MITCREVSKNFRGRTVLQSINLDIAPGICALLGPNGAGKSTLLKLLTGLQLPDAGHISIAGLDLAQQPTEVKRIIGVLPEELGLFQTLTVTENLHAVGPIYGLSADETQRRTADLLRLLDLEHGRHTPVSMCSYGMRKKTALALALLHNPEVLFLDEPFEGIDPSSSRVIERTLADLAGMGVTILLTSHLLPLVEQLASRVLILHGGSLVWDSDQHQQSSSLQQTYFTLIGEPAFENLSWLAR